MEDRFLGPDELKEVLSRVKTKDLQEKDDKEKKSFFGIFIAVMAVLLRGLFRYLVGTRHSKFTQPPNPTGLTTASSRQRFRELSLKEHNNNANNNNKNAVHDNQSVRSAGSESVPPNGPNAVGMGTAVIVQSLISRRFSQSNRSVRRVMSSAKSKKKVRRCLF